MTTADRLAWTIAHRAAEMPEGTVFAASFCAIAGIRLAQQLFGNKVYLCGRGGAYDLAGILSLHARHWLFNQRPHAHVTLSGVFETLSEPHSLLATPAQIDGFGNANLSVIGDHTKPKVAFGGTRGLPDARSVHFVMPSHNVRRLVERVDFVSTAASTRDVPAMLITDLCVMRWDAARASWCVESIAPEVSPAELQNRTGFQFAVSTNLAELEQPAGPALALLAQIDPLGLRELDFVGGRREQLDAIGRIYDQEVAMIGKNLVPGHQMAGARSG